MEWTINKNYKRQLCCTQYACKLTIMSFVSSYSLITIIEQRNNEEQEEYNQEVSKKIHQNLDLLRRIVQWKSEDLCIYFYIKKNLMKH